MQPSVDLDFEKVKVRGKAMDWGGGMETPSSLPLEPRNNISLAIHTAPKPSLTGGMWELLADSRGGVRKRFFFLHNLTPLFLFKEKQAQQKGSPSDL